MSISHFDVRKVLRDYLGTMTGVPTIATEGQTFEPVVGEPYVADHQLGGTTYDNSLTSGIIELMGIYQVDVYTPQNQTVWTNEVLADKVIAHFSKNTVLNRNSIELRIRRADHSPVRTDGGWLVTNVSIYYQVLT